MQRQDVAIVVNTCPKYFYLLDAHFGLLRRYGGACQWPVYLATEEPEHTLIQQVRSRYNVKIIALDNRDADFFESRVAAVRALPPEIKYILPIQEDFLLERPGLNVGALTQALEILDTQPKVISLRLMPCPGASSRDTCFGSWNKLQPQDLQFSYQATIWRREVYSEFLFRLAQQSLQMYDTLKPGTKEWNLFAVRTNPAETQQGMVLMQTMFPGTTQLCWPRKAAWANAVYWSPWPYRPTAVVKGTLEPWAAELIRREGFIANPPEPLQ